MKQLTVFIGFLIIAVGVIGLVAPETLIRVGNHIVTPTGLNIVAVLRIAIGLVLIFAASGSRIPRTLRVAGAVVVIAGIATPFFGVARSRVILDWWSAQGPSLIRLLAVLIVGVGSFLIYSVTSVRSRT